MGVADQRQLIDSVSRARTKQTFWGPGDSNQDWKAALDAFNRLAMFDMLPALASVDPISRVFLRDRVFQNKGTLGEVASRRITFAITVIQNREIEDQGLPLEQVNDGREFLGCTRLNDDGVRSVINDALLRARATSTAGACCDAFKAAWVPILVDQRRRPGASLIANLAAAAHYMLARYHVCAAKATAWQMKLVIEGYDSKKRAAIADGDRDLKAIALTGNRPFPPDFAIRNWAYKGADDGDADRMKCNAKAVRSAFPDVNGQEL